MAMLHPEANAINWVQEVLQQKGLTLGTRLRNEDTQEYGKYTFRVDDLQFNESYTGGPCKTKKEAKMQAYLKLQKAWITRGEVPQHRSKEEKQKEKGTGKRPAELGPTTKGTLGRTALRWTNDLNRLQGELSFLVAGAAARAEDDSAAAAGEGSSAPPDAQLTSTLQRLLAATEGVREVLSELGKHLDAHPEHHGLGVSAGPESKRAKVRHGGPGEAAQAAAAAPPVVAEPDGWANGAPYCDPAAAAAAASAPSYTDPRLDPRLAGGMGAGYAFGGPVHGFGGYGAM